MFRLFGLFCLETGDSDHDNWNRKKKVKEHTDIIHEQKRIKCDLCTATLSNVRNMHAHMKSIHKDILVDTGNSKVNDPFWKKYIVSENSSV